MPTILVATCIEERNCACRTTSRSMHMKKTPSSPQSYNCHYAHSGRSPAIAPLAWLAGQLISVGADFSFNLEGTASHPAQRSMSAMVGSGWQGPLRRVETGALATGRLGDLLE
jgi:hypothetical protein